VFTLSNDTHRSSQAPGPSAPAGEPHEAVGLGTLLEAGAPFGDRYTILRHLGTGGMGSVYQAWDSELDIAVALKVINRELLEDPKHAPALEDQFKHELLLARQITHPNIIRIHDLGQLDGTRYFTMPFIEGCDLATIIQRDGALSVPRALRVARAVLGGMAAAHKAQVVHRDLKPANIMVDGNDVPTIMDFGIALSGRVSTLADGLTGATQEGSHEATRIAIAGETQPGGVVGTIAYMAPEQVRSGNLDQRTDIYAFGLIVYDMLLGVRRLQGLAADVELRGRLKAAPTALRGIDPRIPAALDRIVMRCLEPMPARRYQTAAALQDDLNELDTNGVRRPSVRRVRRRTVYAAAAIVLLSVGTAAYFATRSAVPRRDPVPISILIADVQNNSGDRTLDGTLEQALRRGLEGASFITAYDRSRLLPLLGVQPPAALDARTARLLAAKQGLSVVVAAFIERVGREYEISATVSQSASGETVAASSARALDRGRMLEAAAGLTADLRTRLGDWTSRTDQLFAMRSVTTSSLEALGHYAKAIEAQSRSDFEAALENYQKAVDVDPGFGIGYQGLAAMSRNLGRLADGDRYILEALRLVDSMTERERLATRGYYYRVAGDYDQCASEYGALLVKYPYDATAHAQRATCLARLRRYREAVESMVSASRILPNHWGFRVNYAMLLAFSGKFDASAAEVAKVPEPTTSSLIALAYSQMGRGQVEEARQTYEQLGAMGNVGASTAAAGVADIAIYRGRFSEAARILTDRAKLDVAAGTFGRGAMKHAAAAFAHLLAGRDVPAADSARLALSISNSMAVKFLAGRALAETGALDEATRLSETLLAEKTSEPRVHGMILAGITASKAGRRAEAFKLLREANAILDTWFGRFELGRAYFEAGDFAAADGEFDVCLIRRGEALSLMDEGPTSGYLPAVVYYRGRTREALGRPDSESLYLEYVDMRSGSTEDRLVEEVQRRARR
jgi:serine/threonine protein kinase/tetratricopeptide (TPR) repeat protein